MRRAPPGQGDTARIVRGASAASEIAILGAAVHDDFQSAVGATGERIARLVRRPTSAGDQERAGSVVRLWAAFAGDLVAWIAITLYRTPSALRGVLTLRRRVLVHRAAGQARAGSRGLKNAEVFISYRGEHTAQATAIATALSSRGFEVWLDQERGTLPTRLLLLDRVLEDALKRARAVVVMLPSASGAAAGSIAVEETDSQVTSLVHTFGWVLAPFFILPVVLSSPFAARRAVPRRLRAWWYRRVYDLDLHLDKRPAESWQDWERRIAALHGVPVVTVAASTSPAQESADVRLGDPEEDGDAYARLAQLVSAAEPNPDAPIFASRARVRATLRLDADPADRNLLVTTWRFMRLFAAGTGREKRRRSVD